MLRKLLIASLAVFTLASCKKDKNESGNFHMDAKFNGTKVDFSQSLAASVFFDSQDGHTLDVLGFGGVGNNVLPGFSFTINSDTPITTKTYTAAVDGFVAEYDDANAESYSSDGDFTITITSLTATEIRGTFSGKLIKSGVGDDLTVTEGTFYSQLYQ